MPDNPFELYAIAAIEQQIADAAAAEQAVITAERARLALIEKRLDDQEKVLKEILEALKYRVDIQTFTTWIKSVETQLGVDLIKQQFSQGR